MATTSLLLSPHPIHHDQEEAALLLHLRHNRRRRHGGCPRCFRFRRQGKRQESSTHTSTSGPPRGRSRHTGQNAAPWSRPCRPRSRAAPSSPLASHHLH
uniref:Uncharacterized protein n=1 Tax=Oryza nivara TaxID=4536 RepID=A0A0E0HY34_ORYNI